MMRKGKREKGKAVGTVNVRFGFSVTALDQIVLSLVEIGATVLTNLTDSPWVRRAVVKDLDGHTVELNETGA